MPPRKPRKDVGTKSDRAASALFQQSSANVRTLLEVMYQVSISAADREVGERRAWASALFTRLCVLGTSIKTLLPEPIEDTRKSDHWDVSAMAGLTRMFLECCLLFYYLGVEDTSEEEWRDRLNLIHLHDCTARISMFRNLIADEGAAERFEETRATLLLRFTESELLAAKTDKQRKHLLRGDRVMFEIQDDVLQKMGVGVVQFRAWYEVLSSHVHSYPLAFHRMLSDGRGDGTETGIDKVWVALMLDYLHSFMARAVTQMLGLFPDIADPRLSGLKTMRKNTPTV